MHWGKGVCGRQPLRWQLGPIPPQACQSADNSDTWVYLLPQEGWGQQMQPRLEVWTLSPYNGCMRCLECSLPPPSYLINSHASFQLSAKVASYRKPSLTTSLGQVSFSQRTVC